MSKLTIDHSGLHVPEPKPHDDGYEYNISGTIQDGDEWFSSYGSRWEKCGCVGWPMKTHLRYRRPKKGTT